MKHFLDKVLFPKVISFAVNTWHIVALLCLGVVLMTDHRAIVELVGGNYTNVVSATVALLILREEIIQKNSHNDLHSKIDDLHAKLDKKDE